MNDDHDDLEARLGRMPPAEPPPDLMRRLRASEPPERAAHFPWPLAYAGLLAVWALILTLRALTPATPESVVAPAFAAQVGRVPADAPVFASQFLFARNHSDQL